MTRISPILFRLATLSALLCGLFFGAFAQGAQDTRPYAPIANPLPDTLDQLYRDSATIKIGRIRINQAGYRPADDKYFYYVGSGASSFSVIDASTGASVATGTLTSKNTTVSGQIKIRASNNAQRITGGDMRYTMESQAVSGTLYEGKIDVSTPGQYRIRVGTETSGAFWIHENLYGWVRDAAIKFPGVNRCGNTESWFHGACHLKDATLGGWHDCGDHLKEGITQSYLHAMLALGSAALRDHDVDNYGRNHNSTVLTDGIPDVLYEAKHGSDYIIKAYDNAGGQVSRMITSVGGFGPDHQWWGQPEMHDQMSQERGGPPREARNELGANILGLFAAGLALTAKNYAAFDSAYAAKSITVAKALYTYAKANLKNTESPAYNGNGETQDKLAFAALGLLYATKDKTYLNDMCYDKSIYNAGSSDAFPNFGFEGGWFAKQPQFSKGFANTDWGSQHLVVLWGLYRLVLKDEKFCSDIGLTSSERLKLLGRVAGQMLFNINDIKSNMGNTSSISLPSVGHWDNSSPVQIVYDDIWKSMHIQQSWMYNRYQFGNIFDLFAYSDMAMWLDSAGAGITLPGRAAGTNWKGREVRQLVIRQIDYMLGVNLWDFSMIFGIGHKNANHPHHRASNPEGKNVPGAFYPYRPPVGALQAGVPPGVTGGVYSEHYDDYHVTETGIDASATMIIPIMGLAKPDPINGPPDATVRTVYVGADMAIIEVRQARFGMSTIRYAQDGATNFTSVKGDSSGVFHRIVLTNLKSDTKYNFDALIADMFGNTGVVLDDRGELFTFTTLKTPPGPADISNVKVCRVTSDSADIFWFTPNGQYDSRVVYGERKPPTTVHDGNIYGRPTQFHYVKIGGLKEKTTYYFYVESNGARDNNGGQYYTFTTPVEHVEFDVRALMYRDGGRQFLGLNIVNQDIKAYDSLEFRLYIRAPDSITTPNGRMAFQNHFAFRVDIGIKYRSDGYQDTHFKGEIDGLVQASRPIRMEDTYNPADGTWGWYVPVPMGPAEMQSGARFRIDLLTDTRSWFSPYQDLMNQHPSKDLGTVDWSFMPHSKASGDPVDYPGIPIMTKDDTDNDYWNVPINQYITIYRKNEFVWGYSPSVAEQQTKKTHYEMTSQITSPLYNPAEEYLFMEQVMPQITVNGWAKVTENGVINDLWVNGNKVRDVNSVARYDAAADRWNLAIPVPVKSGGNNIDITIFGGPENDCATCYGCAFTNHSFYLEFRGADPYPSSMKLLACANQNTEVKDSAKIDTTCFYVFVDDMNGNLNKDSRDTVWVSVVNPVLGDSVIIPLVESGDSTGRFTSVNSIKIVSTPPARRGPDEISMDGGQVIVITYVDATDPDDISQATLSSRAEFAVPNSAYFRDSQGVGSIDAVYVKYSKPFDATRGDRLPDSLHLTIPGQTGVRVVKAPSANIAADASDRSLIRFTLDPAIENVTGFRANEQMSARSFLVYGGAVKEAVVPVQDSAGPALLYRAMLTERGYGVAITALDTVEITLSEPMPSASIVGTTLVLRRAGADASDDVALTVASAIDSSLLTNSLTFLAHAEGGGPVREGDSIYINPIGPAADRTGNRAHIKNRPVPVVLKTSTPRILSASYFDENADGIIDHVELVLSKSLDLTGLHLSLSWGNGPYIPVEWARLVANADETVVRAAIDSLLVDTVVTAGTMRAMATHNKFPGDTLRANVADKAAPVAKYAQLSPGSADGVRDTLTVTFSEPLVAASARPFTFKHGLTGALYTMVLQNENMTRTAATHTFIVTSLDNGVSYPSSSDSLWINVDVVLYDTSANIQDNENNRRVRLSVKPAPISIALIPAPNPYRPAVKYSGDQPARIIVRPAAKVITELNLKGTITIYDNMGSVVLTDTLKTPPAGSAGLDLVYPWDGYNKKGRKVGTGVYMIVVSVEHKREAWEERLKPITARAKISIIR